MYITILSVEKYEFRRMTCCNAQNRNLLSVGWLSSHCATFMTVTKSARLFVAGRKNAEIRARNRQSLNHDSQSTVISVPHGSRKYCIVIYITLLYYHTLLYIMVFHIIYTSRLHFLIKIVILPRLA